MKTNCRLITVWDGGVEIGVDAFYNPETREIEAHEPVSVNVEVLEREYVQLPDGTELPVCSHCHEYVLRPAVNLQDKNAVEGDECPNPECDNKL